MIEIRKKKAFNNWFENLKNTMGRARILVRIERLIQGKPGDVKPVGEGVSELKINFGPSYRIYYMKAGDKLIILLAEGDKSLQEKDIAKTLEIARRLKE